MIEYLIQNFGHNEEMFKLNQEPYFSEMDFQSNITGVSYH